MRLGAGTTHSNTYTETLAGGAAGTNPSVTVDISGTSAIVIMTATLAPGNNQPADVSFAIGGANTQSASDSRALIATTGLSSASAVHYVTGLIPGSTTFTLQYKVSGSTAQTVSSRNLMVIPMP